MDYHGTPLPDKMIPGTNVVFHYKTMLNGYPTFRVDYVVNF